MESMDISEEYTEKPPKNNDTSLSVQTLNLNCSSQSIKKHVL